MIYNYRVPIGIIQYQEVIDNTYELDLFIGELSLRHHGIGQDAINLIYAYLRDNKHAKKIVGTPQKDNFNSVRCLEKCGFTIEKEYQNIDTIGNEHTYLYMTKKFNKKVSN